MILNDAEIASLCEGDRPMISPFTPESIKRNKDAAAVGIVSYGLSSYGYDIRPSKQFKIFTPALCKVIDPKHLDKDSFIEVEARRDEDGCYSVLIPPNSFALSRSVEEFCLPRDILGVCLGKSTWARCGLNVPLTPLEPEWKGHLTLEMSNTTPLPMRVYANEGIAQILFFRGNPCKTSYADRKGKYQAQGPEIVLPKV